MSKKSQVDLNHVYDYLLDGSYPENSSVLEKRVIRKRAEGFRVQDSSLYHIGGGKKGEESKEKVVILGKQEKWKVIAQMHVDKDGNHLGIEKTTSLVNNGYYWVGIYNMVRQFISQCAVCQVRRSSVSTVLSSDGRWSVVSIPGGTPGSTASSTAGSTTGSVKDEPFDDAASTGALDDTASSIFEVSSVFIDEFGFEPVTTFWSKVELKLCGPYKCGRSQKYILVAVDCFSMWPEAFVLDSISPSNVAHSIVKLICRYGIMGSLVARDDETLQSTLMIAIDILISKSISIPVCNTRYRNMDEVLQELTSTLDSFVANNPQDWLHCVEICLLPVRISCPEYLEYTPAYLAHGREMKLPESLTAKSEQSIQLELHLSDHDRADTVEKLMDIYTVYSKDYSKPVKSQDEMVFRSPKGPKSETSLEQEDVESTPASSQSKGKMVTRSRTGGTKPKRTGGRWAVKEEVEEDVGDVSTATPRMSERQRALHKRKLALSQSTPDSKRAKVDVEIDVSPVKGVSEDEEESGDDEMDTVISLASDSKSSIDVVYRAIQLYLESGQYVPGSNADFKSNIHLLSKRYETLQSRLFYITHSEERKEVPITSTERLELMRDAHIEEDGSHVNGNKMLTSLPGYHWKGKHVDCQAFVMACPLCSYTDPQQVTSFSRRQRYIPDEQNVALDNLEVYNEIQSYLCVKEFSETLGDSKKEELLKHVKKFSLEGNLLFYVEEKVSRTVVVNVDHRLEMIKKSHIVQGKRCNMKTTLQVLKRPYFWFGMDQDVKVYMTLCYDPIFKKEAPEKIKAQERLADKYFTFKNYFLKEASDLEKGGWERRLGAIMDKDYEIEEPLADKDDKEDGEVSSYKDVLDGDQDGEETGPMEEVASGVSVPEKTVAGCWTQDMDKQKPTGEGVFLESTPEVKAASNLLFLGGGSLSAGGTVAGEGSVEGEDRVDDQTEGRIDVTVTIEGATSPSDVATTHQSEEVRTTVVDVSSDATIIPKSEVAVTAETKAAPRQRVDSDPVTMAAVKSILPESGQGDKLAVETGVGQGGRSGVETGVGSTAIQAKLEEEMHLMMEVAVGQGDPHVGTSKDMGDTSREEEMDSEDEELEEDEDADDDDDDDDVESLDMGASESPSKGMRPLTHMSEAFSTPQYTVLPIPKNKPERKEGVTPRPDFECTTCGKVLHGINKYKMHVYRHTGVKPFVCTFCNKKFTNNKSLKYHTRKHTGELPYLCNLCGRSYPGLGSLKSHLRTHEKGGGMPVKCDICQRVFTHRHLMERHKNFKHINLKTEFSCDECSKTFAYQRSLKRHVNAHHRGVRNHSCDQCGKTFARKEYLTSHMIQHAQSGASGTTVRPRRSARSPAIRKIVKEEEDSGSESSSEDDTQEEAVKTRIVLQQDESGQLRLIDPAVEQEVKRMLASHISGGMETMVVEIQQPPDSSSGQEETEVMVQQGGQEKVLLVAGASELPEQHVLQIQEAPVGETVVLPSGEQQYVIQQGADGSTTLQKPTYVAISGANTAGSTSGSSMLFTYAASQADVMSSGQAGTELIYGHPAVQYEVECVGDVGDEEALSAINLLAQASAAQFETIPHTQI